MFRQHSTAQYYFSTSHNFFFPTICLFYFSKEWDALINEGILSGSGTATVGQTRELEKRREGEKREPSITH
jgi:hypothetical protein